MTFIEKLELIERIVALIQRKSTGTSDELAEKLGISRRCVFSLLQIIREIGGPLEYSHQKRSYYFTEKVSFEFGFKILHRELGKISGKRSPYTSFLYERYSQIEI